MNNMNIDEKTMNNIKNMVNNGNISEAISQISPEMIQNFSKIFNQNSQDSQNSNFQESNSQNSNSGNANFQNRNYQNYQNSNSPNGNSNSNSNNFDFSNIDLNTVMKMSSILGKMGNSKNDPRANLLNSLKPYLRDSKKGKLDNYMNLLNVSKIAEIMKNSDNYNTNNHDTNN